MRRRRSEWETICDEEKQKVPPKRTRQAPISRVPRLPLQRLLPCQVVLAGKTGRIVSICDCNWGHEKYTALESILVSPVRLNPSSNCLMQLQACNWRPFARSSSAVPIHKPQCRRMADSGMVWLKTKRLPDLAGQPHGVRKTASVVKWFGVPSNCPNLTSFLFARKSQPWACVRVHMHKASALTLYVSKSQRWPAARDALREMYCTVQW